MVRKYSFWVSKFIFDISNGRSWCSFSECPGPLAQKCWFWNSQYLFSAFLGPQLGPKMCCTHFEIPENSLWNFLGPRSDMLSFEIEHMFFRISLPNCKSAMFETRFQQTCRHLSVFLTARPRCVDHFYMFCVLFVITRLWWIIFAVSKALAKQLRNVDSA